VHAGLAGGRAGVTSITHVDTSPGMLARAQALEEDRRRASGTARGSEGDSGSVAVEYVLADPVGEVLPVEHGQYDVVISCLGLHWVNDVPVRVVWSDCMRYCWLLVCMWACVFQITNWSRGLKT
jgi:SAM-dependent methyltransferase